MVTRRPLGRTGLTVATLGFGTVELGTRYGLPVDGDLPAPPDDEAAVALLHAAFRAGVDLLDTAPGYGRAEEVVGKALARWTGPPPIVATKVPCPPLAALGDAPTLERAVAASLAGSLARLGRTRVDVLQVHNATPEALRDPAFGEALTAAVARGEATHLGASTYGEEAARAALAAPWCETLQLAYNVLDQHPASALLDEAARRGVGIIARSVLLKGVLTERAGSLPAHLAGLAGPAAVVAEVAGALGETLARLALRFVLSDERVAAAVVGIDRPAFLADDLAAWGAPRLPDDVRARLATAHVGTTLTDPRTWGF